jgi:hypothetical protein
MGVLLLAGCLPGVCSQSTRGALRISAIIEASFHVEAKGEGYTSIAEGIADGATLRLAVYPGPVAVRALKANSTSKTYSLVLRRGKAEPIVMHGLLYDATIPVLIPDTQPDGPAALYLYVIPE